MSSGIPSPVPLFDSLAAPHGDREGAHFAARPLPGRDGDYIGKGMDGQPALLMRTRTAIVGTRPPPISLEHLVVDHGLECRIQQPAGPTIQDVFSVVRCVNADRLLQEYFLRAIVPIIYGLPILPSCADVFRAVNTLAELFRRLTLCGLKPIQGLWAELCVVTVSRDPCVLIHAWHTAPHDRYDFSLGPERVEVKSASGTTRTHHFSFEQLHPPEDVQLLVASTFVNEAGGGRTIFDLVDEIRGRIDYNPSLAARVDQVVGATLGANWRQAAETRFDFEESMSSLRFFWPRDVPSIEGPIPDGVSKVEFQSNLMSATPVALPDLTRRGRLFYALWNWQ